MKNLLLFKNLSILCTAVALSAILFSGTALAQNTSSSLRVVVTDANGAAASGIRVNVTHVPTGRSQVVASSTQGIAAMRGLAVGGPYEVSVVGGADYAADVIQNIYLELDKTAVVDLAVRSVIEEIMVTAVAPTGEIAVGVGSAFDRATLDATPSISRDFVSALATDPKIMVDNSVARGPAVSMAGQNFRFNSLTIDGVPQNDNFGLSKNASATQRTPISIDAIEAITVNMAPYDVTYGNFIGGNINIVTKSGTNDFSGSAYYFSTDDSFTGDKSQGDTISIPDFSEDTYGFTLGGPIIEDKLFFFTNYEKFETTRPANALPIEQIAGVTQADVDRVRSVLQTEYGFDPGPYAATDDDQDEKLLVKFDWFINDDHRAIATYQSADGDVIFDDFPTSAALHSNRYNINEEMNAYSLHVFSNWTDNFSTEFKFGTKDVKNRQVSVDSSTNEFWVFTNAGGTIFAGGDRFRHANELDNESDVFRIKGDYVMGDHVITAGWERESKSVRNLFLPFSRGAFVFFGIDALEARDLGFLLFGGSNTGIPSDAEANFTLDVDSFFVQDEWTPTSDLTMTFGLRFDSLSNSDAITDNPNFFARRGYANGENLDGKDLVQPRFGFSWDASDRLTVRGGAGLFGGGSPLIILSNSYAGDGISRTFAGFFAGFFGPPVSDSLDAAVAALPSPTAAFDNMQQYLGVDPVGQTDAIDPSYDILSSWKYSIGVDYLADLGFLGDDWQLSADVIFSDVKTAYNIFEARRSVVDQAPDGRPIYDTPPGADYITTNTNKGSGTVISFNANKMFDTDAGTFDVTFGYTHQDIDELRAYNRFITFETLAFDAGTDLNNPVLAPSKYEVEDRFTGTLTWQKELFGDNVTSLGLVWQARSGRHFTYVFGSQGLSTFGGHEFADWGSESETPGTHLFYVPTSATDQIISGDPGFLADLDQFISDDKCLNKNRGSIMTRNACATGWVNIINLRLAQEINVGDMAFDLMFDIENLGNLLNDDWGRVDSYTAPSNVAPANVAINGAGDQYVLTPSASYVPGDSSTIVSKPEIAALPSVYRIQLGVRFRF
ncbi:MAG: TonB-dependent receptor plug domain-containing protein [Gammaproteobacteria bacterium]|nr:TonB-dependent receptor plug domain-containing protein [Gammaproteobacteria bacterium]